MQKKLNEDFIDTYCEKFASKVTTSFFTDGKEIISGKEILEVTPSKQVNYFVVKLLFRYWQSETKKLESPFFNYKHSEVKQALIEFMNVLSQHIEVHKSKFELLLNHAVKDTLYLAAVPEAYIEIDLEGRGVDKINEKAIAGTLKYLRLYKKEIHDFLSDMRGLTIDDILDEVGPEFEDFDSSEGLAKEVAFLNEVLPITADQVLSDIDDLVDEFDEFDDDDLFERGEEDLIDDKKEKTIPDTTEKPPENQEIEVSSDNINWGDEEMEQEVSDSLAPEAQGGEDEPVAEKAPKQETAVKEPVLEEDSKENESEANNDSIPKEEPIEEIETIKSASKQTVDEMEDEIGEDDTPEQVIEEESDTISQASGEASTVNDQFETPTESVAEHLEKNTESSLMKLISVNHQYMFQKELFNDDTVSFQNALYDLEEYDTFDEAVEFLVQNYAKEFSWDMQSTEVKELLKVLFRKFRD